MEIQNAVYGRDPNGIKKLISGIQTDMGILTSNVMDLKADIVITTIRKNWAGADAENFIKQFQNEYKKYKETIKKYSKSIETILNNEILDFKKQQARNI